MHASPDPPGAWPGALSAPALPVFLTFTITEYSYSVFSIPGGWPASRGKPEAAGACGPVDTRFDWMLYAACCMSI